MTNTSNGQLTPDPGGRPVLLRRLPFAWLALSAACAAVIVITDQVAWLVAIWTATSVGPLTAMERRHRRHEMTDGGST